MQLTERWQAAAFKQGLELVAMHSSCRQPQPRVTLSCNYNIWQLTSPMRLGAPMAWRGSSPARMRFIVKLTQPLVQFGA